MLNGIDPIIIFHFSKLVTDGKVAANKTKLPVTGSILSSLPLPAIPIYLSEKITGLYIDTEERNIDIDTSIETTALADDPVINQRGINNSVKISMLASRDSLGLMLFSALADLIFPKVTSKEYAISYLHGAVTVFQGLIHSFAITQDPGTDKYNITLELLKPGTATKIQSTEVSAVKNVTLDAAKVPGT